jgi:hypothetical protein
VEKTLETPSNPGPRAVAAALERLIPIGGPPTT